MLRTLSLIWHVGQQMGWRYMFFRMGYFAQTKSGLLKLRFPRRSFAGSFWDIREWRQSGHLFFFDARNISLPRNAALADLQWRVRQMHSGSFRYFSNRWYKIQGWHTHPRTGYRYAGGQHWSDVNDFSDEAGDIKFIWEKSRFTFLYDFIRYDYHFNDDQSAQVFKLITDWIECNPVNCGPNWKCSQEISLRVLNWTFALHYYRFSTALTQSLLDKILCSIYNQMLHVAANVRFAAIAVRNNHILTEAAALFTVGLMFPCFPLSKQWRDNGKRIFEREILYQITAEGTYLQFSMNYHRVVVQLITWCIRLSELHNSPLSRQVYSRAVASLNFLRACQNEENGQLPNYGNNDGSLFFPLTECDFGDFRPQLGALARAIGADLGYLNGQWVEESIWMGGSLNLDSRDLQPGKDSIFSFNQDGYHCIRDGSTFTFLRCGPYRSRPFQADHNHIDILVNGRNILRDSGTWQYNAADDDVRYFAGTRGHNTVMIDDFDQMRKHGRFVWTHWITNARAIMGHGGDALWIDAEFTGFRHLGKGIIHHRRVIKAEGKLHWQIVDEVTNLPAGMPLRQLWHPCENFTDDYYMVAADRGGYRIPVRIETGWYSAAYGERTESEMLVFETFGNYIKTIITSKN